MDGTRKYAWYTGRAKTRPVFFLVLTEARERPFAGFARFPVAFSTTE
jgi:hypothetical protein